MKQNQYTIEELAEKVNQNVNSLQNQLKDDMLHKDGRQSSNLSVRRIRDYITKGLLDKPEGNHPNKYFTDHHVEQLTSLRTLQHVGISDTYILNSKSNLDYSNSLDYGASTSNRGSLLNSEPVYSKDAELSNYKDVKEKDSAMNFLMGLKSGQNLSPTKSLNNVTSQSVGVPIFASNAEPANNLRGKNLNFFNSKTEELSNMALSNLKYQSEVFTNYNEYVVDEGLKVFLKMPSNSDKILQEKLLREMKALIKEHFNQIKGVKND